jgi:hypothetical protein
MTGRLTRLLPLLHTCLRRSPFNGTRREATLDGRTRRPLQAHGGVVLPQIHASYPHVSAINLWASVSRMHALHRPSAGCTRNCIASVQLLGELTWK